MCWGFAACLVQPVVFVLNGGFDIQVTADTKNTLPVDIQLVVMGQIIFDSTVSLVWILCMNLLHNLSDLLVFKLPLALSAV